MRYLLQRLLGWFPYGKILNQTQQRFEEMTRMKQDVEQKIMDNRPGPPRLEFVPRFRKGS